MGPACSTHSVPHTGPSGSVPVAARAVAVSMCQGRRACAFQHPGVAGGGAGGLAPLGAPGAGLQAAALQQAGLGGAADASTAMALAASIPDPGPGVQLCFDFINKG